MVWLVEQAADQALDDPRVFAAIRSDVRRSIECIKQRFQGMGNGLAHDLVAEAALVDDNIE